MDSSFTLIFWRRCDLLRSSSSWANPRSSSLISRSTSPRCQSTKDRSSVQMVNNSFDLDYSLEFVLGTRNRFNKSQHICLHTSRSRWKALQLHWCWSPRKTWRQTIEDFRSLDNILWAFVRHLLSVRKLWDLFAARWRKLNEALRLELGGTSRNIRDDKANYATCVQLELSKFKHRLEQLFRDRHFSLAHLSVVSQNLSFAHSWTSTKISDGCLSWPILVADESSSINSTEQTSNRTRREQREKEKEKDVSSLVPRTRRMY